MVHPNAMANARRPYGFGGAPGTVIRGSSALRSALTVSAVRVLNMLLYLVFALGDLLRDERAAREHFIETPRSAPLKFGFEC